MKTDRIPTQSQSAALLERVLEQMREEGKPLLLHEFDCLRLGCSSNALGSRLPEWAKLGLVLGHWKDGMKAWEPGNGTPPEKPRDSRSKPVVAHVVGEAMVKGFYIVSALRPLEIGASVRVA